MRHRDLSFSSLAALALGLASCTGSIGDYAPEDLAPGAPAAPGGEAGRPGVVAGGGAGAAGAAGAVHFATATRRLTNRELRATLLDLFGSEFAQEVDARFQPTTSDGHSVFAPDNEASGLVSISRETIDSLEQLGAAVGARVLADRTMQARIVPCAPTGPEDADCLRRFVTVFGRRALRRALAPQEVEEDYVARFLPYARETKDFYRAVSLVVRALLQNPEFVYHLQVGQPAPGGPPGLVKLTDFEVASRLSYLVWGGPPDDRLLDAAAAGKLSRPADRVAEARRILFETPATASRTARGIRAFHAMWLGYAYFEPAVGGMQEESDALVERVVVRERRPWADIFRAQETFVTTALARHYGLPAPAGGRGFVPYDAAAPRQGILSHGSFLGVDRKFGDTSPTMRGLFIRARLMCQAFEPPPPEELAREMVEIDAPPPRQETDCKLDAWKRIQTRAGCAVCHAQIDNVGFGLENFDQTGRYRELAPGDERKPHCRIDGRGELRPLGPFVGVAGLSEKLVASDELHACVSRQLGHLLLGREIAGDEERVFEEVGRRFKGGRFDELLLDVVALPAFGYRLPVHLQ